MVAVILASTGVCQSVAFATTVQRKSLSDLAKGAELIFEGQVLASKVSLGANGIPRTCLAFRVLDVIAGSHAGRDLKLCFMGGELNGERTAIADMHYPVIGEHGIYLVESTTLDMVNPLIGWDQGRFLVQADSVSGAQRMTTANHAPILGMSPDAAQATTPGAAIMPPEGTASDVVSDGRAEIAGAMQRDDFKKWLRQARER